MWAGAASTDDDGPPVRALVRRPCMFPPLRAAGHKQKASSPHRKSRSRHWTVSLADRERTIARQVFIDHLLLPWATLFSGLSCISRAGAAAVTATAGPVLACVGNLVVSEPSSFMPPWRPCLMSYGINVQHHYSCFFLLQEKLLYLIALW